MSLEQMPFAAALLAGGKSSRMGRDKALLDWGGQPLWRAQLAKLRSLWPAKLFLSCRTEQALTDTDVRILHDQPGEEGPLPAITHCLAQAEGLPLLVLAVDLVQAEAPFLATLFQQATPQTGLIYKGDHGYEPLAAVYPTGMLPLLQKAVASGEQRLQVIAQQGVDAGWLQALRVDPTVEAFFFNMNRPSDLPWTPPPA